MPSSGPCSLATIPPTADRPPCDRSGRACAEDACHFMASSSDYKKGSRPGACGCGRARRDEGRDGPGTRRDGGANKPEPGNSALSERLALDPKGPPGKRGVQAAVQSEVKTVCRIRRRSRVRVAPENPLGERPFARGVANRRHACVLDYPTITPRRQNVWRTRSTKNAARRAAFQEAADGTRTHDLLHGNRLANAHKRLVLRFSAESDYRGLPGIRRLLVPQWSPDTSASSTGARVSDTFPTLEMSGGRCPRQSRCRCMLTRPSGA
jgi:hypothetical protein